MVRLVVPTTPPQQQQPVAVMTNISDSPNGAQAGQISPASCPSPVSDCTSVVSTVSSLSSSCNVNGGRSGTPSNGATSPALSAATGNHSSKSVSQSGPLPGQPQTAIVQPQVQQLQHQQPPPPPHQMMSQHMHHAAQVQAQLAQMHHHNMHNGGQMVGPPPGGNAGDCNGHGGAPPPPGNGGPLYIAPYTCEYYGDHNYYYAPGPEICPAHQAPICTLHEYGKRNREGGIGGYIDLGGNLKWD